MRSLYLLHQNKRTDRHFLKPENVVCVVLGPISGDAGPGDLGNKGRVRALDRLRALSVDDGSLSFGELGAVWRIEVDDGQALETTPEDAAAN